MCVDLRHFAKQIPERIDEVDARLIDQQSRVATKKRLPIEIRVVSPPVAHAHQEMDMGEGSGRSRTLDTLDLAIPGLPAPVLMHHEAHARRARHLHDAARAVERWR